MSLSPVPPLFIQSHSASSEEDPDATFVFYNCPWEDKECWKIEETKQDSSCGFYAVMCDKLRGVIQGPHQHIRHLAVEKLKECLNSQGTAFKNETLQKLFLKNNSLDMDKFLARLMNTNYLLNPFEVQMVGEAHDLRVEIISENNYNESTCENERFLPHRDDDERQLVVVYNDGEQFSRCKRVST